MHVTLIIIVNYLLFIIYYLVIIDNYWHVTLPIIVKTPALHIHSPCLSTMISHEQKIQKKQEQMKMARGTRSMNM